MMAPDLDDSLRLVACVGARLGDVPIDQVLAAPPGQAAVHSDLSCSCRLRPGNAQDG
jgi:hypothetical protein